MPTPDDMDLTAALDWAREVVGPVTEVRELSGGMTSTMLSLTRGAGDPVVLRLMTREPWRTHGRDLTTRESRIQLMLAGTSIPVPRSVALDADGRHCGHPAHLMTLLPGRVDVDRVDPTSLRQLADLLAAIHDQAPVADLRAYESWAWEEKYRVPPWAEDPGLWEEAFAVLRAEPPAYQPCLIHRDFHLRNVLWSEGAVSGVVDWVETSVGPAWLDVAHCCTNLALTHGTDTAAAFARQYGHRTGRQPQPYFEVMDVVGFLPPPGKPGWFTDPAQLSRLEGWLQCVMGRVQRLC